MKAPEGKFAWTATVGEKGQIVIPKQAREIFGIKPGDTLLLLGDVERGIAIPPKGAFAELFGAAFKIRAVKKNEKGGVFLHSCPWAYQSHAPSGCGTGKAGQQGQILFL